MSKKTRIVMYSLLVVMLVFAVGSFFYKQSKVNSAPPANASTQTESIQEIEPIK